MAVWVLSDDLFSRLLKKLDENGINYELYAATVVTDSGQHPTLCIEVNGKNYCREGGD